MLPGLLATALLAPAQPPAALPAPAPAVQPAPAPPVVNGPPPGLDPSVCAPGSDGGFSFDTTHAGPPWTLWGGADYRLLWLRPAPSPGVLATADGRPFGDRQTEFGRQSGVGFDLGGWVNDRHTVGVYGSGLLVEQKSRADAVTGGQVTRPVLDVLAAAPANFLVADAARGVTGSLATEQGIRLSGFEVGGVNSLVRSCNWSADYLVGFRYLDLDEVLTVTQATNLSPTFGPLPLAGTTPPGINAPGFTLTDRFRTRNQFYGPQAGLRGEYRTGGFFAGLSAKLGIGNNHERVDIDGRTDVPGRPGVSGGLLALPGANLGSTTTNRFAVLVDLGVSGGYQFAPWGRARIGYDFLYLNDVARPGQQVDPAINSRFVPTSTNFAGSTSGTAGSGLVSPIVTRRTDDFYAHGLRFGLELLY